MQVHSPLQISFFLLAVLREVWKIQQTNLVCIFWLSTNSACEIFVVVAYRVLLKIPRSSALPSFFHLTMLNVDGLQGVPQNPIESMLTTYS